MTAWRWAALAGFVTLAIGMGFGAIPGINACGGSGDAILRFEFVRAPGDVAALFPDSCRAVHVAAQRHGLWLDGMGFIPAYTAFILLSLIALRHEGGALAARFSGLAIAAALVAAVCDQFEGAQLFRLLNSLPGTQATIDLLIPAVRTKFALLALVVAAVGVFHAAQPGWRRAAGTIIALASLASLAMLVIDPFRMMPWNALAWIALLATNIALSFRKVA